MLSQKDLKESKKERLKKEINWLLDEKYSGNLTEKTKKDIQKLKSGEPIDYLIGFVDFLGCKIDLSLRPLIPRQETEFWVGKAIENIKNNNKKNLEFLDIFSGSGCIGVAVLKACYNNCQRVDFAETDEKMLKQAGINLKINKIPVKKYRLIKSNVFQNIKDQYDYIFSNPPYVNPRAKNRLQKSVYSFEPHQALFGGSDGLFFIKRFLKTAKNHLKKDGKIYMEFDSSQKKAIIEILKKYNYKKYEFCKDQYEKWRYLIISY